MFVRMSDFTVKRIDEMEAAFRGGFKKARAELGVTSFGLQVLDFPPDVTQYPEHDHAESGQEEVFAVIRGSGKIVIDDEDEVALEPDVFVRVGPNDKRKIYSGPDGLRIIALGGTPGKAYEAPEITELEGASA
jgi:mannose-6-phosphate isomerase-like protein (cupin superfamily)